jgi:hypothetical protein
MKVKIKSVTTDSYQSVFVSFSSPGYVVLGKNCGTVLAWLSSAQTFTALACLKFGLDVFWHDLLCSSFSLQAYS